MKGISAQSLENKAKVLKQERQQLAKKHSKFYDIRERFRREIDRKAAELRKTGKPASKPARTGECWDSVGTIMRVFPLTLVVFSLINPTDCIFKAYNTDGLKELHIYFIAVNVAHILKYTERQKKLITSSGRRSLKSTPSKLIFGHK